MRILIIRLLFLWSLSLASITIGAAPQVLNTTAGPAPALACELLRQQALWSAGTSSPLYRGDLVAGRTTTEVVRSTMPPVV